MSYQSPCGYEDARCERCRHPHCTHNEGGRCRAVACNCVDFVTSDGEVDRK